MSSPTDTDPRRRRRTTFRVLGGLVLLVGVFLFLVALVDFFGAMNSDSIDDGPGRFWLAFVGLPLMAIGGWLLQAGYLGAMSSYVAGETAPAIRRTAAAWSGEDSGRACPQCGKAVRADARFCDGCGTALA